MKERMENVFTQRQAASPADIGCHLQSIHDVISSRYPFIDRIAVAIYDAPTDVLSTFVSSDHSGPTLQRHQARLTDVPSLSQLASNRQSRVVHDIKGAFSSESTHSTWLRDRGFRSSYTVPVYHRNKLAAFVFFDSCQPHAFGADSGCFLDVFATLISQLYLLELRLVHGLVGTVHIASGLATIRDLETGQHLERMALYSRLIARGLAGPLGLKDEYVEYLHLFAPLHDVGKVGIPDAVLLKPAKLDAEEWQIMRRHVEIGEGIIDRLVEDMDLVDSLAATVMHNIVACHHERGDGSGYPRALQMNQIPLEGRIVAVADVYDALSNRRPYKAAWNPERVASELDREVQCGRLDEQCVQMLMSAQAEREDIGRRFADPYGVQDQ